MNIACAFIVVIGSVGVFLLGVTHPLWENISGVRYSLIRGREVEESRPVAGIVLFIKTLERTSFGICLCM